MKIFSKHLIVPEAHSFNSVLKVEVEKEKNVLRLAARCQVTLPIARGPTLSSTRATATLAAKRLLVAAERSRAGATTTPALAFLT